MPFLITYRCERGPKPPIYGHDVVDDIVKFLEDCTREYKDETYILLNQLCISAEEAKRIDGAIGGM